MVKVLSCSLRLYSAIVSQHPGQLCIPTIPPPYHVVQLCALLFIYILDHKMGTTYYSFLDMIFSKFARVSLQLWKTQEVN